MAAEPKAGERQPSSRMAGLYSFPSGRPVPYRDFSASRRETRAWFFESLARSRERAERHRCETAPAPTPQPTPPAAPPLAPPVPDAGIALEHPAIDVMIPESPEAEPPEVEPAAETRLSENEETEAERPPDVSPLPGEPGARWHALRELLGNAEEGTAARQELAPVLLLFSMAGGVGKTTIAASLARALSAQGERVLVAGFDPGNLLALAFGAGEARPEENGPGVLRTFAPPGTSPDLPVGTVHFEIDSFPSDCSRAGQQQTGADPVLDFLRHHAGQIDRILIDVPTNATSIARRLLPLAPLVLAPLIPGASSAATLSALEKFFAPAARDHGIEGPFYLLNQFDAGRTLHEFEREALARRLDGRLLPFALHHDSRVSEALAEGMTVLDFAPASTAAQDFRKLAAWLRALSPPAARLAGRRWTEVSK